MTFDYSKLRGRIRELYHTERDFAKMLGTTKATLSAKLNGHGEFTQSEIEKACKLLNIDALELKAYFFNEKVK